MITNFKHAVTFETHGAINYQKQKSIHGPHSVNVRIFLMKMITRVMTIYVYCIIFRPKTPHTISQKSLLNFLDNVECGRQTTRHT